MSWIVSVEHEYLVSPDCRCVDHVISYHNPIPHPVGSTFGEAWMWHKHPSVPILYSDPVIIHPRVFKPCATHFGEEWGTDDPCSLILVVFMEVRRCAPSKGCSEGMRKRDLDNLGQIFESGNYSSMNRKILRFASQYQSMRFLLF